MVSRAHRAALLARIHERRELFMAGLAAARLTGPESRPMVAFGPYVGRNSSFSVLQYNCCSSTSKGRPAGANLYSKIGSGPGIRT
jgi:hypothetical protein